MVSKANCQMDNQHSSAKKVEQTAECNAIQHCAAISAKLCFSSGPPAASDGLQKSCIHLISIWRGERVSDEIGCSECIGRCLFVQLRNAVLSVSKAWQLPLMSSRTATAMSQRLWMWWRWSIAT